VETSHHHCRVETNLPRRSPPGGNWLVLPPTAPPAIAGGANLLMSVSIFHHIILNITKYNEKNF